MALHKTVFPTRADVGEQRTMVLEVFWVTLRLKVPEEAWLSKWPG
jgi:hypothetical protein